MNRRLSPFSPSKCPFLCHCRLPPAPAIINSLEWPNNREGGSIVYEFIHLYSNYWHPISETRGGCVDHMWKVDNPSAYSWGQQDLCIGLLKRHCWLFFSLQKQYLNFFKYQYVEMQVFYVKLIDESSEKNLWNGNIGWLLRFLQHVPPVLAALALLSKTIIRVINCVQHCHAWSFNNKLYQKNQNKIV